MASFVLSCCSTADLTKEHFEERDIHYICFHYWLNGVEHPDDLGQTIPFPEFYKAMAEGADTKTSQINISEYLEYFEKFLSQGLDVLHVTLSSGISGTYNSAADAANICRERSRSGRSTTWIPWGPLPATACSWMPWRISGTRA